jgi:hypothetical protein
VIGAYPPKKLTAKEKKRLEEEQKKKEEEEAELAKIPKTETNENVLTSAISW